tara:strand:- start:767 stop:973 length:207 start_codon:yes stop_codon:yes gene_type:complete
MFGNKPKQCKLCHNRGYIHTYNTQMDVDEIQRCDECWFENQPWSLPSDEVAFNEMQFTKQYWSIKENQ